MIPNPTPGADEIEREKRIEAEVERRWQAILAGGDDDSDVVIVELPGDSGVSR